MSQRRATESRRRTTVRKIESRPYGERSETFWLTDRCHWGTCPRTAIWEIVPDVDVRDAESGLFCTRHGWAMVKRIDKQAARQEAASVQPAAGDGDREDGDDAENVS